VMQLGFILSKTLSGDVQLLLGYQQFFLWTLLAGLPVLLLLPFVRLGRPADAP
jgi:PAT family beta-lactamase induction signal transducer AmpG